MNRQIKGNIIYIIRADILIGPQMQKQKENKYQFRHSRPCLSNRYTCTANLFDAAKIDNLVITYHQVVAVFGD